MTVQINRSDQLIGSNWIRKGNPERSTVGRVLPTMGRVLPTVGHVLPTVGGVLPTMGRVLPTVGRGLPTENCLCGQVKDFGAKCMDFHCTTTQET